MSLRASRQENGDRHHFVRLKWCLSPIFLLLVPLFGSAAQEENPYQAAKVGDWASYAKVTQSAAGPIESAQKRTVTAKDDKSVTVTIESTVAGKKTVKPPVKILLDEPLDHTGHRGGSAERMGEGDEVLTVNGQPYPCHWVQTRITVTEGENKVRTESKVWVCKTVPLSGVVKIESATEGTATTITLSGFGRGP
jgi:hypothetical protein